jgi:hypothetical protein
MIKKSLPYLLMIITISIALIVLVWIDHDTETWSQVFPFGILSAWIFYGLPILIVMTIVYQFLKKKMNSKPAILFSALFGIPFSTAFLVVLYTFLLK